MNVNEQIRVVVVDDDVLIRNGVAALIEGDAGIDVIEKLEDGLAVVRHIESLSPDVVVMDIAMPYVDGIKATDYVVQRMPQTKVLILSNHDDGSSVRQAIDAGACGFVLKDNASRDLVFAIRAVASGQMYLSPEVSSELLTSITREQTVSLPGKTTKRV